MPDKVAARDSYRIDIDQKRDEGGRKVHQTVLEMNDGQLRGCRLAVVSRRHIARRSQTLHNLRKGSLLRQKETIKEEWKMGTVEKGFTVSSKSGSQVTAGRGNWHVWWVWPAGSFWGRPLRHCGTCALSLIALWLENARREKSRSNLLPCAPSPRSNPSLRYCIVSHPGSSNSQSCIIE